MFFASNLCAAVLPEQIAIIVNKNDAMSLEIGNYYQQKRNIPDENIIRIEFPVTGSMGSHLFSMLRQQIVAQTPEQVQFYVLAWSKPYKVACMSITSAMTFGFDRKYCAHDCSPTEPSVYFNSNSLSPFNDFKIRPTIMLAGSSMKQVKAMIDHGVQSDGTFPTGTGYLVTTSDAARNVRSYVFETISAAYSNRIKIEVSETDALHKKQDVLFYFTGGVEVKGLKTNRFLPGAIADHLTSSGGVLFGDRQMSILKWLDAGATGSYGTVTEPCAFPQKFPHPGIVIDRYTRGESLIEAYWKSVAWPGQGLFVGEPMAAPFYNSHDQ
ncbi:MAG: TIGR03790 family protein [Burkholderiales bacterium]|nr:TIGR03790 family protein [Nitrosomonas sp.]MCP5273379.1 TIGR03790 family protein [Burkholderiales bacterium]